MINFTILPALILFVSAPIVYFLKGKMSRVFAILAVLVSLLNVALIKPGITSWNVNFMDVQITLLKADKLSLFVAYIFLIIGTLSMVYSFYCEDKRIHFLTVIYMGASLGVVFAGDFLSLYIFWELMAFASTGLILCKGTEESIIVGIRYLIMHLIGGALLLAGIFINFSIYGSLAIARPESNIAAILIMLGIGLNCAFIFLHTWLPDSYPKAPFWASIFMSVYTTKTAVYLLARVAPGWEFVAYTGAAMSVFGVTLALMQSNARKLLSYHIISQVGYMVAGIGLGGILGINGAIFHLWNHILYKSLLFMGIGAVIYRTGEEDLTKLGGLSRQMPLTTLSVVIASLSIAGVPLFNGFFSKDMIFEAAHNNEVVYLMLKLAAIGTFLSFFKFCYFGFIRRNEHNEKIKEAPIGMTIAMLIVAVMNIAIGVYPGLITKILPLDMETPVFTFESVAGKLQIMFGVALVFILGSRFFEPHKRNIRDFDFLYVKGAIGFISVIVKMAYLDNAIHGIYYIGKSLILGINRYLDNFGMKIRDKQDIVYQRIAKRMLVFSLGEPTEFATRSGHLAGREELTGEVEIDTEQVRITPAGSAVLIVTTVFSVYLLIYILWNSLF